MRFGSVASGIEAASVAFGPLGWQAAWFSEIDAFPRAVLAHHYPTVPNFGDMRCLPALLRAGLIEAPDVLCGGTPCQAFSVAGLRRSLDDERGNLTLTFCEIANAIDDARLQAHNPPVIALWENVPGVLSTPDNAFGCFLGELAGSGCPLDPEPRPAVGKSSRYWRWVKERGQHAPSWPDAGCVLGPRRAIAWRTLDAQYAGLAQRRRRVFVVASAREDFDPAQVLFEWQGLRRDHPPRRGQAQNAAGTLAGGARQRGGYSHDDGALVGTLTSNFKGDGAGRECQLIVGTLQANGRAAGSATQQDAEAGLLLAYGGNRSSGPREVASALSAHGGTGRHDFESETFVTHAQAPSYSIRTANTSSNGWGIQEEVTHTVDTAQGFAVAHSLRGEGFDASEDGTGRGTPLVPVLSFDCKASGMVGFGVGEVASTLRAMGHAESHANGGGQLGVAYTTKLHNTASNNAGKLFEERTPALDANSPAAALLTAAQVRRLMPVECERLQGFPDGYTAIPWDGWRKMDASETPESCAAEGLPTRRSKSGQWYVQDCDGPRYKALGNSWPVPVVAWIGRRIDAEARRVP